MHAPEGDLIFFIFECYIPISLATIISWRSDVDWLRAAASYQTAAG